MGIRDITFAANVRMVLVKIVLSLFFPFNTCLTVVATKQAVSLNQSFNVFWQT